MANRSKDKIEPNKFVVEHEEMAANFDRKFVLDYESGEIFSEM